MNLRRDAMLAALLGVGFLAGAGEAGTVNADLLNVRLSPELKAPVVVKLRAGDTVDVEKEVGQFYEINAPQKTPVYISGIYVRDGKTTEALKMYADMSATSPLLGELPAGTAIKVVRETRYGWTQIEPPAGIRLYAAKLYIDVKNPLPKPVEAAKPVEPVKPAETVKPVEVAKPVETVKPAEAPKPVEEVKPAEAPKPVEAVKPAPAPAPAEQKTPVAFSEKYVKELATLGVVPTEGTELKTTGYVLALSSTTTDLVKYALLRQEGNRYITEYFLSTETVDLAKYVEKTVTLEGVACKVPEWKNPLLLVRGVVEK